MPFFIRGSEVERFWEKKKLSEMSRDEWEALCDGCGKCCMEKLIFEDGSLEFTNVACAQLDLVSCRCMHYADRNAYVPECVHLTPKDLDEIGWLPKTCAYRLLKEGKPLPKWHPLITGNKDSVHDAKMSARGRAVPAKPADEFIDYIVDWDDL